MRRGTNLARLFEHTKRPPSEPNRNRYQHTVPL